MIRTSTRTGFASLLTLLFIALKLTGYIDWSWWWVLSPLLFAALIWIAGIVIIVGWVDRDLWW